MESLLGQVAVGRSGNRGLIIAESEDVLTLDCDGVVRKVARSAVIWVESVKQEDAVESRIPESELISLPRVNYTKGQRVEAWIIHEQRWYSNYFYCKPDYNPLKHWVRIDDAVAETSLVHDLCLRPYGSKLPPPTPEQVRLVYAA